MSILKFERRTPHSYKEMYEYLTTPDKTTPDAIFGIGCNPRYAAEEMQFVKDVYHKNNIRHPYIQIIFAFNEGLFLPLNLIKKICIDIGQALLLDERQLFGAIHYLGQNTFKIHCHYMINYVGMNSNLYNQYHSLRYYKNRVNDILRYYGLTPIVIYEPTFVSNYS